MFPPWACFTRSRNRISAGGPAISQHTWLLAIVGNWETIALAVVGGAKIMAFGRTIVRLICKYVLISISTS